jgi:hypothetical protein
MRGLPRMTSVIAHPAPYDVMLDVFDDVWDAFDAFDAFGAFESHAF